MELSEELMEMIPPDPEQKINQVVKGEITTKTESQTRADVDYLAMMLGVDL